MLEEPTRCTAPTVSRGEASTVDVDAVETLDKILLVPAGVNYHHGEH